MTYDRRPWLLYGVAFLLYAFLFIPIIVVIGNSFNADSSMVGWGGFTTSWYHTAWSDPIVQDAAKTSVEIALVVTAASAVLGTITALALDRSARWTRGILSGGTYARIVVPELVLALGLLVFLVKIGFPRGFWSIAVGHVVFDSAYVTIIVAARLAARDRALDAAARDLYAGPFRAFWRVTLPDILPAIVTGSLLAFTFSLDDVVTSYFLSGSTNTLPLVILSLVRVTVTPTVNAIGTVLMCATLLAMTMVLIVNWRWSAGARRPDGLG